MDHDEAESAGHERLTGKSRSSGGGGGGGGNGSWGCRLLRRGCDLARKAAIAGAAATAAPLVAPPLIVLSAAGVALSVPFAAYLASLAATNYLTGALLHSCYPPPQPYHHQQEDDDVEQEFLDASEEYGWKAPPAFCHLDTQTELGIVEDKELDEGDTLSLLPRDHGVSEAQVPPFVDQVGGEFSSVQESGLESYTSDRGYGTGEPEHTAMVGMEPTGKEVPPGGTGLSASDEDNLVQKEGEGEFSVLDSGQQSLQFQSENFGFSDPRVPASGKDDNVVQEKGEGRFSVQNSGQQLFQSGNWNEKEEEEEEEEGKTMEENKSSHETPSEGFYFPEPRVLGSADKDDVVQDKDEDEFSAHNLGQYSLLSNTEDEREQDIIMEEKKSTEDIPPRDFVVFESPAPVLHGEDDVVPTNEGFDVAVKEVLEEASSDTDLVSDVQVQITPFAAPASEVLALGNLAARETPLDLVIGEVIDVDVSVAAAAEPESEVLQPTSESKCDPATGESVDVQVDNVGAAAPGSEVLPLSSLAACESQVVMETAHVGESIGITEMEDTVRDFGDVSKKEAAKAMEENKSESTNETMSQGFYFPESRVPSSVDDDNVVKEKGEGEFSAQNSGQYSLSPNTGDKNEQGMTMKEKKSTEDIPPRDFVVSEPPAPVLHAEDDVVPTNEGFEVAVQEVSEGANGDADLIMGEVTHVQLGVVAIAAPESEVLPPSNLAARESPPVDLVTGEVVDLDVGIAAAAEPESEVLQPTSESQCDHATGGSVDVQVDRVGAAAPGSEVLPLSILAACESHAVAETAHVGETIGITVMEDTVRNFGDVSKKEDAKTREENKSESTNDTVSQGFYFPESHVPSGDDANVVQEKREGEFSAQNLGQYSLSSNTGDKMEQGVTMEENKSIEDMPPRESVISASSVPVLRDEDNVVQSKEGFEAAVLEVMEEANSTTDLVIGEVADGQVEIIAIAAPETEGEVLPPSNVVARELPSDLAAAAPGSEVLHPSNLATSESPADPVTEEIVVMQVDIVAAAAPGREVLPLSSLADFESEAVAENAHVGEVTGITVMEDIVRDFGDVSTEGVSFVSVESVHDGEDVMSSGTTPYFSTMEEEMIEEPNQSTGVGYAMMNEAFGSRTLAGGEAHYTEEQLREQLDTIRTITGYGAVSSPTLEGELAGLYIFVGVEVEPAVGAVDTSDRLMELNAKLRFLKSIIGVD